MKKKSNITVEEIHTKQSLAPAYIIRPENKTWYIYIETGKSLPEGLNISKLANYVRMIADGL